MDTEFNRLKRFESADVEAVLARLEKSFNIKFDYNSLGGVNSYRMLADIISSKINLEHADTCTTQQAFYKLRHAIAAATGRQKSLINPKTRLSEVLPQENLSQTIEKIEEELNIKLCVLGPKAWVVRVFLFALLCSLAGFSIDWHIAIAGCLTSVLGLKLAGKFGKEIHLKTVGDLANKISRESYIKARRNPTVNRTEIEQKVRELFAVELELKPVLITRKSRF
ncbi:MAG: hypothetical protein JSU01_19375 [Bacteroidetes bacterium]|nr:hypothetical protein [Bacteroidota bacterium]